MERKRTALSLYRVYVFSQRFAELTKKKTKEDHSELFFEFVKYMHEHMHDEIPKTRSTKRWLSLITEN